VLLSKGWTEHPPVQWMVQGYLGITPKSKQDNDQEFDMLLSQLTGSAPAPRE